MKRNHSSPQVNFEMTLIGSVASGIRRGGNLKGDIDLVVVSPWFEKIPFLLRSDFFRRQAEIGRLGRLDIICFTPAELARAKNERWPILFP